jgi:hypothetical protein
MNKFQYAYLLRNILNPFRLVTCFNEAVFQDHLNCDCISQLKLVSLGINLVLICIAPTTRISDRIDNNVLIQTSILLSKAQELRVHRYVQRNQRRRC